MNSMFKHPDQDEKFRPRKGMVSISQEVLLYELIDNLHRTEQWDQPGMDYDFRSSNMKYLAATEYVLELLEVLECGSVGGFAPGQSDKTLSGRIDWQIRRLR